MAINTVQPQQSRPPLSEVELNMLLALGTTKLAAVSPVSESGDESLDKTCVNIVIPKMAEAVSPAARRYGRYEVVRKLGEGGMGAVFLANDTESGEHVALKVLSDDCLKQPDAFRRFENPVSLHLAKVNPS